MRGKKGKEKPQVQKLVFSKERDEALQQLYELLDKNVGKGAGRPLPQLAIEPVGRIPTTVLGIDRILGGGVPRGRITEFYGSESGGKTTLALLTIAQIQREGGRAAYLDLEGAFDPLWAQKMGVDVATMHYDQPESGDKAIEEVLLMVKSRTIDLIVVDSVSALVPEAELKGHIADQTVGRQAALMSKACRNLAGPVHASNCAVLFINQIREKMDTGGYGNPETTSGGRALKFYASVRLDIRRAEAIRRGEDVVGHDVRLKTVKNKTAPPQQQVAVPFMFAKGFDREREIVQLAETAGAVKKTGNWYAAGGTKLGNGIDATTAYVEAHPELLAELRAKVVEFLQTGELYA